MHCLNINNQLISTLSVSISISSNPGTTGTTALYTAIIDAIGGTAPAFPTGTVTILPQLGFTSTAAGGIVCDGFWAIQEDEYPGNFATSIQNLGGGTHEAASDGTYLYVLSHGLNEVTKFDGGLTRVSSLTVGDYPHDCVVLGSDLWIVNFESASLQRISLSSFTVSNTYPITGSKGGFGVGTDGTNLWIGAGTHAQGSAIYSVNTSTGAMTSLSTDVDTGAANIPVKFLSGSLWSINQGNGQVKRINPSGGATIATINCNIGTIYGLGVGGGYVFANCHRGVAQIDPSTNTVVRTYLYRDLSPGGSNIEVVGGRAYACGNTGVAVIDYTSGTIEEALTDAGCTKWCRALPSGQVVVGYYASPMMHVIEAKTAGGGGTAVLAGYLSGLTLSNDAVTPNTVIDIASGAAVSDDGAELMTLSSAITKTTGTWAAGAGNGGLDTGSVAASTWYHLFLIKRIDTGVVDVLLSTSATSPTLPTNYTKKRRIGAIRTDSSGNILAFVQIGNEFIWSTPVNDLAQTANPGTSAVLIAATVPAGVSVRAKIAFNVLRSPASGGIFGLVSSPLVPDTAPGATAFNVLVNSQASSDALGGTIVAEIWTNTSRQYRYRLSASDANTNVTSVTLGWADVL